MQDEQSSPRAEPAAEPGRTFCFAVFRFDSEGLLLFENGKAVRLGPKPLGVLKCLLERPGEVVSKQHLMEAVWHETFVAEHSLAQAINRLRHTLADDPESPTYIQTIHRRGYRFIAPVSVDGKASGPEPTGGIADDSPLSRSAGADGDLPQVIGPLGNSLNRC